MIRLVENIQFQPDLYTIIINDQEMMVVPGNTAWDDQPLKFYYWDVNSSLTDDGENVIQPTAVVGNGRFIKLHNTQLQTDWNATSGVQQLLNKPVINSQSIASPTRALNTIYQNSSTQNMLASYSVDVACTLSLTTGQTGTVSLQYADNVGFTTNVVTVQSAVNGNTGSLTIGLNLTQTATAAVTGVIPSGKYYRVFTTSNVGSPTFTLRQSQETLI